MRTKSLRLQRVHFMPKEFEEGVLYVSEEFGAVIHLCACGCQTKVHTPTGRTGWTFTDDSGGPTLSPSIGSFQIACKSHYLIRNGDVVWCG